MKKAIKFSVFMGGASIAAFGAGYGACCLISDVLFNRRLVLPAGLTQKISGCDNSHHGDYLANNLKWVEDYGYETYRTASSRGEKLTGYLMRPKEKSDTYIFCAHGYRSYGKKEFSAVSQYYLEKGYNVFMVDHVASGESDGEYCTFGHYEVEDCLSWLSFMNAVFGKDIKIILHGVSMGAATVMMMSDKEALPKNVRAIIADCGFTTARELFSFKLGEMNIPDKHLISAVNFANKRRAGFDFDSLCPVDCVKNARVPMMFIHGDKDNLVPCYMANKLYEACGNEKELLIVEGADHAQSYKVGNEEYKKKMESFLSAVLSTD